MKRLCESKILFAIVFFAILLILGWGADKNMYEFKVEGKTEANYEYIGGGAGDFATEFYANFPYKTDFVDINGLGRRLIGQREMNKVLKLNNGYLTQAGPVMKPECIEANANAIIAFNNSCKENGTLFVYVSPAYKISKYDPQLPEGTSDGHNETIDLLLARLSAAGVPIIDLREEMYTDGINQYDLYYRTDHHWTTEGAFYAYQKIAQWVAEQTSTELDPELLDLNNYQIDTYPQWHLGMRGQRTGSAYAGIDDFDLIYPRFETHIQKKNDGTILSLKDALVRTDLFQKANAQNRYTYDSAYTANDINNLVSLDAKSDLSVWLLSDSFQQAIKPYQLLTYKDYHVGGYGSLSTSFILDNKPDVVVMLPWPGYFNQDTIFTNFVDDVPQQYDFVFQNGTWLANGEDLNGVRVLKENGISYGPYVGFREGRYRVTIHGNGLSRARVDSIYAGGTQIEINMISADDQEIVYEFNLSERVANGETRIFNTTSENIEIHSEHIDYLGTGQ